MKCVFCNTDLVETTKVEERRDKDGNLIIFSDVPVLYCRHCLEYFYEDKVLDWIEEKLKDGVPHTTTLPGYNYKSLLKSSVV
jgi:YgiT-type zinc finger domain-containing protein